MPIQIYWKLHPQKLKVFQIKILIFFIDLLKWGGSNEYPQSMILSRNKKNNVFPCKRGLNIYRRVFVMWNMICAETACMVINPLRVNNFASLIRALEHWIFSSPRTYWRLPPQYVSDDWHLTINVYSLVLFVEFLCSGFRLRLGPVSMRYHRACHLCGSHLNPPTHTHRRPAIAGIAFERFVENY